MRKIEQRLGKQCCGACPCHAQRREQGKAACIAAGKPGDQSAGNGDHGQRVGLQHASVRGKGMLGAACRVAKPFNCAGQFAQAGRQPDQIEKTAAGIEREHGLGRMRQDFSEHVQPRTMFIAPNQEVGTRTLKAFSQGVRDAHAFRVDRMQLTHAGQVADGESLVHCPLQEVVVFSAGEVVSRWPQLSRKQANCAKDPAPYRDVAAAGIAKMRRDGEGFAAQVELGKGPDRNRIRALRVHPGPFAAIPCGPDAPAVDRVIGIGSHPVNEVAEKSRFNRLVIINEAQGIVRRVRDGGIQCKRFAGAGFFDPAELQTGLRVCVLESRQTG